MKENELPEWLQIRCAIGRSIRGVPEPGDHDLMRKLFNDYAIVKRDEISQVHAIMEHW
jgi:hypothetical protein